MPAVGAKSERTAAATEAETAAAAATTEAAAAAATTEAAAAATEAGAGAPPALHPAAPAAATAAATAPGPFAAVGPSPIRSILLRLVTLVLLPLVVLVAGYGLWNVELQRRSVDRGIVEAARTLSVRIEHDILAAQAALATLALSPYLQSGDLEAFHAQASRAAQPFHGWILVTDTERRQLLNTRRPFGTELPTPAAEDVTERVFSAGQPAVSGLFFGRVAQRPVVAVSVPVYQNERVAYELRMAFRGDRFAPLLAGGGRPDGWLALLVDREGQTIAHTAAADQAAADRIGAWIRGRPAGDATGTLEGSATAAALVVAFETSSITGWSTAVAAPSRLVNRPITHAAVIILAGALLSLLLAAAAALVIGRRIALPLQSLASQADAIVRGERVPAVIRSLREVEDLRRALVKAAEVSRRQFATQMRLERETRAREHAERTRAEIEKRDRHIRRLIDSNLIGIVIANERCVVEANDVFLKMVGHSRQALAAGEISWRRMTPPEQQPLGDRAVAELRRLGEIAPFEKEYLRADGGRVPVLIGAARIDADPASLTWVGFVIDLTPQKRAAAALLASEQRYRGLAEAIASVVWTTAADGSATDMRQWRELTDQTPQEYAGWGWIDALHPDDRPATRLQWQHAIASGEPIDIEFRVCTSSRRYRWYNARGVPVRNADGSIREWVGVGFDIDGRKAAETRQLLLTAELDHRVRNILATVRSMVSLTADAVATKADFATRLQGRIATMARVHDLLSGLGWQGAPLLRLVRDELAAYADQGRTIAIAGDERLTLRPRDALDISLVLHELAVNAATHGALSVPGGELRVDWSVDDGGEADGGDGRLVFRWQERGGPAALAQRHRGFGSRLIANVFSAGGGRRADVGFAADGFQCTLEMAVAADALLPSPAAEAAPAMPAGRVLVVEDEPLIAMQMHRLLSQAGIDVCGPAATLAEALDLARDATLAAAILDIRLGDDGTDAVADALLARRLPITFVIPAGGSPAATRRGQPTLRKPIEPWRLLESVRSMLATAGDGQA